MAGIDVVLQSAWSATQAALSVVLILLYGYIARWKELVSSEGETNMSKVSTTLFLPCLLFSQVGPLSTWDNLKEYWAIIAYSLFFQLVSYMFGELGVRVFRMPRWVVPCMIFNNTTSMPLLLIAALSKTGSLDCLVDEGDTLAGVVQRGTVYILINSLVGNLTRFTFGPHMMGEHPKEVIHPWTSSESPHAPKSLTEGDDLDLDAEIERYSPIPEDLDEDSPLLGSTGSLDNPNPSYSPRSTVSWTAAQNRRRSSVLSTWSLNAPQSRSARARFRRFRRAVFEVFNPAMVGGILAVIVGVVPFFHYLMFGEDAPLKPLTVSFENLGHLYAVLQMFVLGAHLRSKGYARPKYFTLVYLFLFRFLLIPILTCATVAWVRVHWGGAVLQDKVFDFVMMISAAGPPALTLAAIVELANVDDATNTAVATTVVISYALAPFISISVTMALYVVDHWLKAYY